MRQPMIVAALVLCMPITVAAQQSARLKVERSYQLPRHSYPISTTAMALFQDDQQFAALAQQVAASCVAVGVEGMQYPPRFQGSTTGPSSRLVRALAASGLRDEGHMATSQRSAE